MKKAAVIVGVVCLLASMVQADIGVRSRSDGGVFLASGDWATGPYPDTGALWQLVWSPVAPVITGLSPSEIAGGKAGELILDSGAMGSYGYLAPAASATVVTVPGANDGWLVMRIYQDATPELGDLFYQSVNPTAPPLIEYDPQNPGTVFDHRATAAGEPQATNGTVIPEPATLGLWGLGLLTILVRRKIRR